MFLVVGVLGCVPLVNATPGVATVICLGLSAISVVFILSALNDASAKIILDAEGIEIVIADKRIQKKSRYNSYYFRLGPWEHQQSFSEVAVSKSLYQRKQPNDKVYLQYNEGALGMPWYQLPPQ